MNILHFKRAVKQNPLGAWILSVKESIENKRLYGRRMPYLPAIRQLVGGGKICLISSNCFAGRIMQDIGMEYNTPTLGLYFMYPDYIEFLQHLEFYLKEAKITFVDHSKYPLGDERRAERSITHHWYPIGLLDGKVEIHFLHYHTEEEAASKWYRRAKRVDFNNLLVIGMDQNLCTENDIRAFDNLPFQHKIMFSTHNIQELKSNVYMDEFKGKDSVGDPYKKADLYYKYMVKKFSVSCT